MILTLDLGTSATKAVVWDMDGPVAVGRARVVTTFGPGGRAEQDPNQWWPSVVAACADARHRGAPGAPGPGPLAAVEAIGLTAARQTLVPVSASAEPIGPALVWSDRRATAEAVTLAQSCGGRDAVQRRTGIFLDGAAVAAKVAWLAAHGTPELAAARWLVAPRDLVVHRLTGRVVTDTTLASATGLYANDGSEVAALVGAAAGKLPEVVAPDTVVGVVGPGPAAELGVEPGLPVVIGAGDRPSEALGTAATPRRPMVSWGTTANVSVPLAELPSPLPSGLVHTRGALGGWLLEGGTAAAGSWLAWLATVTATPGDTLFEQAATSPPGARGLVALAWPGGARAPWWRDGADAALLGLSLHHGPGDLCRAMVEAVAFEVDRCLRAAGPPAAIDTLSLAGGGGHERLWVDVVTAVTGVPAVIRRSSEAASAGAALLVARALHTPVDLERINPVVDEVAPDPLLVERYAALADPANRAAVAVIDLDLGGRPDAGADNGTGADNGPGADDGPGADGGGGLPP